MKKTLLTLSVAAVLPVVANAQRYLGIATSNWSGTNGVYLNPANLADSRHKFTIDLFSLNFGVDNSLATINRKEIIDQVYRGNSGKFTDAYTLKNDGKFSLQAPFAEVRGPGFMMAIGHKHGIALTTRVRALNQFHDFDRNLYTAVADSSVKLTDNGIKADPFNWTAHLWSEIGLSYGGVIYEKGKHMVKGGLTVRYMLGAGYLSATSTGINGNFVQTANDVQINATQANLQYRQGGVNFTNVNSSSDFFDNIGKNSGSGFGGDLGVVYEFRPKPNKYNYDMDGKTNIVDRSKNRYLLRFSAAVTDLGAITYKDGNKQVNFAGGTNAIQGPLSGNEIAKKVKSYDEMKDYLLSKGIKADSSTGQSSKVSLPTALNVNVDVNVAKNFYVNAMYIANLADRFKVGNSYYNQVTITPRYDIRAFSFGLPITYNMLSNKMKLGAGVRIAGFFIGSDDALAFVSDNQYGVNFYMGAYVPFNKRKPKDRDGDLVSNKKDKCPNEKGVWEMMGCPNPDKDGDGILDKDDKCPDVAGSKTAMGCPDADLDSVADAEDRCPNESGAVAMMGCPDRDKDGIVDIDDICPDQPGLPQFKGCPDTDGDGLSDNEDACPTAAGPIANQGCPDTDNDGIPDHKDKCPTIPGTVANQGCPEVSIQVKKRLAFAATAIQFETGKAVIKKTSFKLLDEVVKILNDYPDYIMTIDGHTDNVGKPEKNLVLSKDRAASVKNYFVGKGVASDRLETNGFGDTRPAASNKTAAGRAKNRRVAMDLKLRD